MLRNKKGFTLIEMLVVIAIIAVLVSIVLPAVSTSSNKAQAAADAANLRSILGVLNSELAIGTPIATAVDKVTAPESKYIEGAVMKVFYAEPGFIDVYYVNGDAYYGLEYLAEVANYNSSELSTAEPSVPGGTWYTVTG